MLVFFVVDILTLVPFLLIYNFVLCLFIKVLFIFNFVYQFQFLHILFLLIFNFFPFIKVILVFNSSLNPNFWSLFFFIFFLLLNLFSFSISPFNKKNIFIFYVNFDSHSFYFFIILLIFFYSFILQSNMKFNLHFNFNLYFF